MEQDLGLGVSFVDDQAGYNYDTVVYQKGKPPLDSELNLAQGLGNDLRSRQRLDLPSGWLSYYPVYTNRTLVNSFYTQNPTGAKPEFALVNGNVVYVTNTAPNTVTSQQNNTNLIQLETPPTSGNIIDGIILEVWRALLSPNSSANKPDPTTVIDSLRGIYMFDSNNGWICGDNGLILGTQNGGQTWTILPTDTKFILNGIFFSTQNIGWVVGNNGTILRTSSAGTRWTALTSGRTENLYSIHAYNQLIAWAVGDSGLILKTTNSINWAPLVSGVTTNLKKVHFHDQLTGWVVGESGTILKTTNGGSNWVPQVSGTTETLNSIYFYDGNYGFAVGNNGIVLKTTTGGASWVVQGTISTTEDLMDVTMAPNLDHDDTEDVTLQVVPSGTSFTVYHKPITKGDGNGTITNDPKYVTVEISRDGGTTWSPVLVDSINGASGIVILNSAPGYNTNVRVSYHYKEGSAVFEGKAWTVGTGGQIWYTEDIGDKWTPQTSGVAYDLLSVDFINQTTGWVCGAESVIRNTTDSGDTWTAQQSEVFSRMTQRVFNEGNIRTNVYLNDNSIHPDTNIETTKRVQIQYQIRVISGVDSAFNPEAGLSSGILGEGPNASGTYGYENMGSINGDYGCWRAKCLNTVDGYVYAIPMFFVSRRNSSGYNITTNPNGSHQKGTAFIRPDLLTASNVVDIDILDVRRRIVNPDATEFLTVNFDALMANTLKTNLFRLSTGGDRYGTELLQTDLVGAGTGDLRAAVDGNISSEVTIESIIPVEIDAGTTVPVPWSQTISDGIFHTQPSRFKVIYIAGTSPYNGRPVPGYFSGFGTKTITFTFSDLTVTNSQNTNVTKYRITAEYIKTDNPSLTYVPSEPKLVKNFSSTGNAFLYQGVMDTDEYRVIETWDSVEAPGYQDYAIAYTSKNATDTEQTYRASPVEVHYFMKVSSSDLRSGDLIVPVNMYSDKTDVPYKIYSVRRIKNITSGFSHRLKDIVPYTDSTIDYRKITPVPGYEFIVGMILEVVAMVDSASGESNVRNGAAVNFNSSLKRVYNFTRSYVQKNLTSLTVTIPNTEIIGCSTTETASGLNQPIYWNNTTGIMEQPSDPFSAWAGAGTSTITIPGSLGSLETISIQLLVRETQLSYQGTGAGLLISYNFVPPQSPNSLPTTLTVDPVAVPSVMYVSNLGSGGGIAGEPYLTPLQHLPTNDVTITNDNIFNNMDPMQFANFSIDSGYAQLIPYIPGSFAGGITLSGASVDALARSFYSQVSREISFSCEGLQIAVPRKTFIPIIARIKDPSNVIFMNGEYVMIILSRSILSDRENKTGYFSGGNCAIAVYRLPHRPISR